MLRPLAQYSKNYDNGWNNSNMVDSVDYNTNNTQATSFTQNNYSDSPNHHNNYNNDNSFVYEHNYNNGNVASSTALLEEEQLNSCLKKPQTNHSNGSIGKGHLILKGIFDITVWTKRNKEMYFKDFCPSLYKEVGSKKRCFISLIRGY